MPTNGHTTMFNIKVWESKIVKKLIANVNHYPTEASRMAYIDSHMDGEPYKHLAAKSRIRAQKLLSMVKKMFKVLQKAYSDVNQAHTVMNKFWDLKMTKDFNSFWAKFQIMASELDHNKIMLISILKFKLTSSLSQAMAGRVLRSKNIHEYAQQCQLAY